jgi:hypothetical protein
MHNPINKVLSKEFYYNGSSLAMGKCLDLMRWMSSFVGCPQTQMTFANLTVLTEMVVHAAPSHEHQLRTNILPSLSGVIGVYTINLCAPILGSW